MRRGYWFLGWHDARSAVTGATAATHPVGHVRTVGVPKCSLGSGRSRPDTILIFAETVGLNVNGGRCLEIDFSGYHERARSLKLGFDLVEHFQIKNAPGDACQVCLYAPRVETIIYLG